MPFLSVYRRAALHMWKQRLGSDATYQKLIDIFEGAGYCSYADIVRNIASSVEIQSEMDDSSDYDEFISQPETYPHHKPNLSLSPKFLTQKPSSCDEYLQINPTAARNLPQGKNCIYIANVNLY